MIKYPKVKHGIVNRMTETFFPYQGWPSVCSDDEGVLYAVASGFRMGHVCPFGKTVMYISRDEGETWSLPMVINDTYLDDRDAGIICLGEKKLLISWFTNHAQMYKTERFQQINSKGPAASGILEMYDSLPEEKKWGRSYIRLSDDGGMTWGDTITLPVSTPHGPIVLRDSSLFYLGKEHTPEKQKETSAAISAYRSTDGGYNWNYVSTLTLPEDGLGWECFFEPHALELPDGTFLAAIRAQGKNVANERAIYTSFSKDGGKTWTPMKCMGVNGLPPHLMLHSSGAIINSFGRRSEPFGQRAAVSYDNGKTWAEEYILFEGARTADLGYPCSVELSDGSILTVYYQKYGDDPYCSILYTKWRLE